MYINFSTVISLTFYKSSRYLQNETERNTFWDIRSVIFIPLFDIECKSTNAALQLEIHKIANFSVEPLFLGNAHGA